MLILRVPRVFIQASYNRTEQPATLLAHNDGSCCVRLHPAKRLTGFKLCTTTPINMQQQGVEIAQHVTSNDVASGCTRL